MSELDFEARLGGSLRAYAQGGVRPIDRYAIAEATIVAGTTTSRWHWSTAVSRHAWLPIVVGLLLLALAAGATIVALRSLVPPRPPTSHTFVITHESAPCTTPDGGTSTLTGITMVDFTGRTTRRVIDCEAGVVLSPDGLHAVGIGPGHLELIDLQTGNRQAIAGADGPGVEPIAWSPRGTFLHWLRDAEAGTPASVFVGPLGDIRRSRPPEPPDGGFFCCVKWSADESRALFQSGDGNGWVIGDGDGTHVRPVTEQGISILAISPDGARLAVAVERMNGGDVVAVDAAEGNGFLPNRRVTHFPDGIRAMAAAWSPDGSTLAVVNTDRIPPVTSAAPTRHELWLVAGNGTQRHFDLPAGDDSSLSGMSVRWTSDGAHLLIGRHTIRQSPAGSENHSYSFVVISARDGRLASGDGWQRGSADLVFFSPEGSHYVNLTDPTEVVSLDGSGNIPLGKLIEPGDIGSQLVWIP